ncbi:MAG: hypothetical protein NPIRA05_04780 [Nitrospirales bacterium]|nr:MAG: hypothetical protein NPIRA05_04780 [Nitrospirales bacterium]
MIVYTYRASQALGDVLLSLGAVRQLNRFFDQNALLWIGKTNICDLLLNAGEVDHTMGLESCVFADLYGGHDLWSDETHDILRVCSPVVGWFGDLDRNVVQNLYDYVIQSLFSLRTMSV